MRDQAPDIVILGLTVKKMPRSCLHSRAMASRPDHDGDAGRRCCGGIRVEVASLSKVSPTEIVETMRDLFANSSDDVEHSRIVSRARSRVTMTHVTPRSFNKIAFRSPRLDAPDSTVFSAVVATLPGAGGVPPGARHADGTLAAHEVSRAHSLTDTSRSPRDGTAAASGHLTGAAHEEVRMSTYPMGQLWKAR